ncbi:unnamed protein product [Vitrella brassicaformis CCMP3155]|uniref:Uncharacterized protein n=1 Tax=Vitrella brassicaformis (strain CCMP3155) TaxID=1169540 RepID=A0A0G4EPM6_VITBC|nr:unnamed protein product [Vitrella brassicaformis CCMP3155]|eukprot:CEL99783.1 unnamed protein product [Vitrella brassicaformis CCMP3155]
MGHRPLSDVPARGPISGREQRPPHQSEGGDAGGVHGPKGSTTATTVALVEEDGEVFAKQATFGDSVAVVIRPDGLEGTIEGQLMKVPATELPLPAEQAVDKRGRVAGQDQRRAPVQRGSAAKKTEVAPRQQAPLLDCHP